MALDVQEPERVLYLALPEDAWEMIAARDLPKAAIRKFNVRVLVYHPEKETVIKWLD